MGLNCEWFKGTLRRAARHASRLYGDPLNLNAAAEYMYKAYCTELKKRKIPVVNPTDVAQQIQQLSGCEDCED